MRTFVISVTAGLLLSLAMNCITITIVNHQGKRIEELQLQDTTLVHDLRILDYKIEHIDSL